MLILEIIRSFKGTTNANPDNYSLIDIAAMGCFYFLYQNIIRLYD